jgi:hypothetical protein
MSHRRRLFAVLAITVSLLLAGAPVATALPDPDLASPAGIKRLLDWLGGWENFLGRDSDAAEAPAYSDLDLAIPVPADASPPTLQTSVIEGEVGPDADPDG